MKLREMTNQRDDLDARCRDLEKVRLENDRLMQIEIQSKKLKEQKREDDFQLQLVSDKLRDSDRQNEILKQRCEEYEQII